jgi:X-linked retinitis pigmentosa GTPase regulator
VKRVELRVKEKLSGQEDNFNINAIENDILSETIDNEEINPEHELFNLEQEFEKLKRANQKNNQEVEQPNKLKSINLLGDDIHFTPINEVPNNMSPNELVNELNSNNIMDLIETKSDSEEEVVLDNIDNKSDEEFINEESEEEAKIIEVNNNEQTVIEEKETVVEDEEETATDEEEEETVVEDEEETATDEEEEETASDEEEEETASDEEEEETVAEEEEETVAEEEEETASDEEEEETEVIDVIIDGVKYAAENKINSDIYSLDEDGDVLFDENDEPVIVGEYKNGEVNLF